MLFAKESEEVCSTIFKTKEKQYFLVGKNVLSLNTIETDDKIIKHETFIGFNDVKYPYSFGKKNLIYALP